jgi:hypothetical protein
VGFRGTQGQGPTECFMWEAAWAEYQLLAVGLAWSLSIKGHTLRLGYGAEPCGGRLALGKRRSNGQKTRPVRPAISEGEGGGEGEAFS